MCGACGAADAGARRLRHSRGTGSPSSWPFHADPPPPSLQPSRDFPRVLCLARSHDRSDTHVSPRPWVAGREGRAETDGAGICGPAPRRARPQLSAEPPSKRPAAALVKQRHAGRTVAAPVPASKAALGFRAPSPPRRWGLPPAPQCCPGACGGGGGVPSPGLGGVVRRGLRFQAPHLHPRSSVGDRKGGAGS